MNPTDNLYYDWPLVTLIIGGHEPQWAEDVVARVREVDNETLIVVMTLMVIVARQEAGRN